MSTRAISAPEPSWIRTACLPTLRYWFQTEVHVHAFSLAANLLLSFFPFLIVMLSFCENVLRWKAASNAVFFMLNDYFPDQMGQFLSRNLLATLISRGPFQAFSVLLLLFTANGIFVPLEVGFNRVWGCRSNRSYLKNQLMNLGLIFICGGLVLLSTTLTALDTTYFRQLSGPASRMAGLILFRVAAIPLSILMLFLIYWIVPNCPVSRKRILLAAIAVALCLELLKYVNILTWPYLRMKLAVEYGPFLYSVTIILWGFFAAMLIFAGAEWAARKK